MTWLLNNLDVVLQDLGWHLFLALPPIVLSLVIATPIGWLVHRRRVARGLVVSGVGLLYAIPSLPLFIILPLIIGTGLRSPLNIIIALTLYGLALMVRSAAAAFSAIDPNTLDAAVATGHNRAQHFWTVQLPLAGPALLAGLRVVAVSTVSLVTVGGVLGAAGLGRQFVDGFQRAIVAEIVTGIVLTLLLALALDGLLVLLGKLLMPWQERRT